MTYYGVITPANRRQSERVGGGSGKNEKHITIRLKQITNEPAGFSSPRIFPIAGGVAVVRLLQRGPGLGADAGVVVAGEMARALHGRVLRHARGIANRYSCSSRCLRRNWMVVRN